MSTVTWRVIRALVAASFRLRIGDLVLGAAADGRRHGEPFRSAIRQEGYECSRGLGPEEPLKQRAIEDLISHEGPVD
jgi:hypothetical protein